MKKIFIGIAILLAVAIGLYSQCTVTLPSIVYANSWIGQSANVGSSTVYTLPANGLYRANISVRQYGGTGGLIAETTYGSPASAGFYYCWADPNSGPVGQVCLFSGQASQAVTFDTRNLSGGGTFDAYLTIERLQ
jgi:hypothetical protein